MLQVNAQEQPKIWKDGQYKVAENISGAWYVDGVEVDPNDLFGINKYVNQQKAENKEKLSNSFDERIEHHTKWKNHWESLIAKANALYKNSVETKHSKTMEFNNYLRSKDCNSYYDLAAADRKVGKEYMSGISKAKSAQIRATSDTIFYGMLAFNEAKEIGTYNMMQSYANQTLG